VQEELLTLLASDSDRLFDEVRALVNDQVPVLGALPEAKLRVLWDDFREVLREFLVSADTDALDLWAAEIGTYEEVPGYSMIEMLRALDALASAWLALLFERIEDRSRLLDAVLCMEQGISAVRVARMRAEWGRKEEALQSLSLEFRESEARFERLVECAPAAIATTDLTGTINYVSGRCLEMYGAESADALLGRNSMELLSERDRPRAMANLARTLEVGSLIDEPYLLLRADGSTYPGELSAAVVTDDDGIPVGFVAAVTDVTVRRRAEETIADYQHRLRQLATDRALAEEHERRRIAADLHDGVGQSLAMARMTLHNARTLLPEDSEAAAAISDVLPMLAEAIRGTRSLTWQLASPLLHEVGLGAALEALVEQMAGEHDLGITYRDMGLAAVTPDANLATVVFQAVRELLLNVVKHADASRAEVTGSAGEETAEVLVEDDGCGFDRASLQLQSKDERRFGLFAIRERIELLGGKLTIQTSEGRGASVSVCFPLTPPPR